MALFRRTVLAAAAVVAVGALATAATAAPTFTVYVATTPAPNGLHSDTSATNTVFTDVTSPYRYAITCSRGTSSGNFPGTAAAKSGTGIMSVVNISYTSCVGSQPALVSYTATPNTNFSLDVTAVPAGSATFTVNGVSFLMFAQGCEFDVVGTTDAIFTNQTQRLAYAPAAGSGHLLTAKSVTGCFGLISNGDQIAMTGTFVIAARTSGGLSGPLKFISP